MRVGSLAPLVGEARRFRTHHEGGTTPHIGVVVELGVLQLCRQDADAFLLKEGDALLRRTGHAGHGENGANTGAYQVGIVEVGQRIANNNGISLRSVGTTQHGTQVAWLLHALQHHQQGIVGQLQIIKRMRLHPDLSHHTLCAAAIGNLLIDIGRNGHHAGIHIDAVGQQCRTVEHRVNLVAGLHAMFQFPATLHDEKPRLATFRRLLLKRQQTLDLRVLSTRYFLFLHHIACKDTK